MNTDKEIRQFLQMYSLNYIGFYDVKFNKLIYCNPTKYYTYSNKWIPVPNGLNYLVESDNNKAPWNIMKDVYYSKEFIELICKGLTPNES